ncbi:ribose-phosphate pyrophosphokinase [Cyclobacterium marinum]|uniref:ribose-phosphate diphosphokinase n=1 Tax=Cyclobacterium marinum (strain ATCC 25205 / DSM 745 / LMG 13164 / NCIMB 1802) TaxID=880070 RepID=G0J557_CYCMS|nr:ribose-phosphate pyrophosphokinase [Cyclobacterium marinum]AEL26741.1 ribose-phosphate pyrophosphokinase [Cyclobacterium marinum DSM 745]MBI0400089.1 ribose-phosphate pyrophosphokinase [Cyclobacterium marinum]MBR9778083.1 ribose-phosphate pyrophosphokinase [Cytophagales bacterium]|tara:strand:+ start:33394 stop:34320 length:927 start_codon:yes stop_codon:yes gene_type:complete
MPETKIFSGSNTPLLAQSIAKSYGQALGDLTLAKFSDGEMSPSYNESIRGCNVFLVQSTNPSADNLLELCLMIDAAKRASAYKVCAVIPYFGYARQDRKDRPRVSIAAKLIANMITSAGADRIMTCDLHAGQIQGFFDIPLDHLNGSAIFVPYLKSLDLGNLIFASPDVGGVGRTRSYAKHFEVDMVVCDKHRKRANEVASMQLIGDVTGKDVVMIDDLVDTAGTMCKAAQIIMDKGATSVRAIATHGVLSGKAYENIENSVLSELVITDTIPVSQESSKIKVLTVADLFAKAIHAVTGNTSISSLFI